MPKRKKGLLTIELTLLISLILSLMLFFTSLIYLIHIRESVRNAISEASKSISTEIYIYTKISQDTELSKFSTAINDRASKELGFNINLTELASKELLSSCLERKTYKILGFDRGEPPFWLDGNPDVEVEALSNNLYITSHIPIKLPVLSLFLKDMELEVKNVEAARGAEEALTGTSKIKNDDAKAEHRTIVICSHSLDEKNPKPVYHDSHCFGRFWEKKENSIELDSSEVFINKNGSLSYKGRTYTYCKFCKSSREKRGGKDD